MASALFLVPLSIACIGASWWLCAYRSLPLPQTCALKCPTGPMSLEVSKGRRHCPNIFLFLQHPCLRVCTVSRGLVVVISNLPVLLSSWDNSMTKYSGRLLSDLKFTVKPKFDFKAKMQQISPLGHCQNNKMVIHFIKNNQTFKINLYTRFSSSWF